MTDLKVTEFLPTLEEIVKLDPNDAEANYILKFSVTALGNLNSTSEDRFEEAFYLIQSLSDRTWEQINSGVFRDVPLATRKVYAVSCFIKIVFLFNNSPHEKELEECCKILDNALLVGFTDGLYNKANNFIHEVSLYLNEKLGIPEPTKLSFIHPIEYDENCKCEIDRVDCPSVEFFAKFYFTQRQPVLLRNTLNHWPAMEKWRDPNYLLAVAGQRYVPIEIGSNYTTEDWSQEMTKLKDFLRRQFGEDQSNEVEYLAQHELFDQIPFLKDDIRIPDYCCLGSNEPGDVDIKAWLGPKGTVSPMHQDPKHNILCQVFGTKRVILASVDDTEYLYPHKTKMLENTSELDAENIDLEKFPLAKNATFYNLILQEGDALYIPPKWWHFVRSLSKSFSVSFWWE